MANFTQRHDAKEQSIFICGFHPIQDALMRFDTDQPGDGVRVEEEAVHNSILRPVSWLRSNFISIPTNGDSRKNWTRLLGCRSFSRKAANA